MASRARWTLTMLGVVLLTCRTAEAQDETRVIEVVTNAPYASVYVDDVLFGRASKRFLNVPVASQSVQLVLAGKDNWSIPPISTTVPNDQSPGDTVTVVLNFSHHYRFESTPYGAEIRRLSEGTVLGTTPLELTTEEPLDGSVSFHLDGYWPEEIDPGREIWNVHAIRLRPIDLDNASTSSVTWRPPHQRRKWIDYAALGTAAIAGVVAVHYKFKADRRYDDYRESGDPDIRSEVKRLDLYSGVALGVMQAGVGLFAIRLVLR